MKFLIDNTPEDLKKVWVHTKEKAVLPTYPYTFEASEKELESIYEGIKEAKTEWNEYFSEARDALGDNLVIGGIFEHWAGQEQPELFEYVVATVEHFHFDQGVLRISGLVEQFEGAKHRGVEPAGSGQPI